jgi:hypothetical protein
MHPATHTLDTGDAHQPAHLIPPEPQACPASGPPHLPHPIHTLVAPVQLEYLVHQIRLFQLR